MAASFVSSIKRREKRGGSRSCKSTLAFQARMPQLQRRFLLTPRVQSATSRTVNAM